MKFGLKAKALILSTLFIPTLVGTVFASYTITDNANAIGKQISLEIPDRNFFLKAGVWDTSNPVYFAHFWNGAADYDAKLIACETEGYYYCEASIAYKNVCFVRMPTGSTSIVWDDKWNQTQDLTVDSTKDTYQITAWGGDDKISSGEWIVHSHDEKVSHFTITAATESECAVKKATRYCGVCGEILGETTFTHHEHLTEHAALAPTCTENGHTHYYSCDHCEKYFSDSAASNEITDKSSVVVAKTGHSFTTVFGSNETTHWLICDHECGATTTPEAHNFVAGVCTVCGYVQAHAHNYENHPAVAATCTTAGNEQYYTCTGCDHIFDVNHDQIVSIPTIAALGHHYVNHICDRDNCGNVEAGYTLVHFTCQYNTYGNGDLFIAGIGGWSNFLAMYWTTGDIWKLDIALETGSSITFKVIYRPKSGSDVWEGGDNRTWTIPNTENTYVCNWQ